MDKITGALLAEFSKEYSITDLEEDARFERFGAFLTVKRHYSETAFHCSDLVVGGGNDTGIDAIAIIVNNNLITDVDSITELVEVNGYLDATFVFIQAERTSGFDSAKIGQFGYGVRDFFGAGKLKQSDEIKAAVEIMNAIFDLSSKFKKGKPAYLFYENVRDWTGYNQINSEIRSTLSSDNKDLFVLMNNGITIIAKSLQTTGHKFTMGDFQIVNGCQTSHVLRDNVELLTEAVRIPVRIICTPDEAVMESIITATNRQTEVTADQFFALRPFAKKLELYFKTFEGDKQLFYERRTHQYDSQDIPKSRVVVHQNLVRAVGAMFLGEPHRTTRNYKSLAEQVGKNFFSDGDRLEPYYVAAFAAHKLEPLFRNKRLPAIYKAGRFHILLAARLLMDTEALPQMNSHLMGKRCEVMIQQLRDKAEDILLEAAEIVDKVAGKNWNRDHIRTQPITDGIFAHFGQKKGGQYYNYALPGTSAGSKSQLRIAPRLALVLLRGPSIVPNRFT